MFKPNELEAMSMVIDEQVKALENQIMQDIIRRIRINGEITRSADWHINRLYELGMAKEDIRKAIQEHLDLSDKEIHEMYSNVIESGYARDKSVYTKMGASQIPFAENDGLQQLISAVSVQTGGELKNITRSLGFAVRQPDGKLKSQSAAEFYQNTLDNAVMGIASGAFDYNTVIKNTIAQMTNSGLRVVDYATGWSNRIEVAARRAVMTGMSQLTAKVNEDNARELGTDMYEVTWHSGARPEHQVWQGKWYTKAQLVSVCGLGTVTGLCGANCYHDYYPVIPGISEPTYTSEELARLNAQDNKPMEYNGKRYTKYEALQRQRRLETAMRAQRQKINLLELAGADEDDIINARCRYMGTSQEYTAFSKAMGLPQQRERVTMDRLGNIGVGKRTKPVDKSGGSGIINMGAISGALNPYSKAAESHAKQYYESVRHMKTDTERISKFTKISKDKIDKIKNHVFIDEHDLIDGKHRFSPSYDMAQSWQRLINGSFEEKDVILLKHEYAELRYMEKGLTQNEAHIKASKKYNYARFCE